jgi:hypothetical protein
MERYKLHPKVIAAFLSGGATEESGGVRSGAWGLHHLPLGCHSQSPIRSLGLWGNDIEFKLPDALPELPKRPRTLPAVEVEAVRRRVDLHTKLSPPSTT